MLVLASHAPVRERQEHDVITSIAIFDIYCDVAPDIES